MAALASAVVAEPAIDDTTPEVEQTLTATSADSGTWQWFSCGADGCVPVGASVTDTNSSSYPVASTDQGRQLKAQLTVAGVEASESAESSLTASVVAPPPKITSPPTLSATPPAYVENTVTVASGGTASKATSMTWQWHRCGTICEPAAAATISPTAYVVGAADVGKQLKVLLTATNDDGIIAAAFSDGTITVPNPPKIISGPTISPSTVEVGQTAGAAATTAYGTKAWQWFLCEGDAEASTGSSVHAGCSEIAGATTSSYVVADADAGSWLGVRLTVAGKGPSQFAYSAHNPIPERLPPPGTPNPRPPAPFTSTGTTPETPETPLASAPTLLDPFPIVRIKGRTTRVGARLSLFSVRAPRGTRIRVRCRSDYCPRSRLALNTRLHRLSVFERSLRAGVVIEVRVMHPKKIGKYTRFLIRRAAPPLRRDACLAPGSRKPTRCPGN